MTPKIHPCAYIIGVDMGTTSTKSVLFTEAGQAIGKAGLSYPLYSPTRAIAEQDPDEIFAAVVKTVRRVMDDSGIAPSQILGLCFSAAMHSLILLDANHQPISRSITWADSRSAGWDLWIQQSCDAQALYQRTGTPLHPMLPLVKLVWLRHEHPDLFQRAARFISMKEYVLYRLMGRYVVDHSMAAAMGLLNLERLTWDEEALSLAGIGPEALPELVPTTTVIQGLVPTLAEAMGLAAKTPLVVGAGDGVLSNLGLGAIAPGQVVLTLGTSGAVRVGVDRPMTDPQGRLFCYPLTQQLWMLGGAVNNGGIALSWLSRHLTNASQNAGQVTPGQSVAQQSETNQQASEATYDQLLALAATVPPGAEGLLFHPYLMGERSPLWDVNARASFFGLGLHHTQAHWVRSVLEGVVYNLYFVLQALEDGVGPAQRIQATGGFAQSALWRQMVADIFNCEVVIPEQYESSCLGAAVLGLYALGRVPSLAAVKAMVGETHCHHPQPKAVAAYQRVLPVFERLTQVFGAEYGAIAALQRQLSENAEGL